MYAINVESINEFLNNNNQIKLKLDIYKYLNSNFKNLNIQTVDDLNNFNYRDLSMNMLKKIYSMPNKNEKKGIFYEITPKESYINILDFIILYSYRVLQGIYAKKNLPKLSKLSITEILGVHKYDLSNNGINLEVPYNQLSKNYLENPFIQSNIINEEITLKTSEDIVSLSEINKFYLDVLIDIYKMCKIGQGFHYKNKYSLWKNRLFIFSVCLKHLKFTEENILTELTSLNNEFKLGIENKDLLIFSKGISYNYSPKSVYSKVHYDYSRYEHYNIYKYL